MNELSDPVPAAWFPSTPCHATFPPGSPIAAHSPGGWTCRAPREEPARGPESLKRPRSEQGLAGSLEAGGRRATAPPWLGGELHRLQNSRSGAAAGVEGNSSRGRGGHLGAPRGPDVPEGSSRALGCGCGAGRRCGARIPRDLGHPGRRCGRVTLRGLWLIKPGSRCVSKQSPPQLLSARIQPPSCRHRKDYLDEEGICP